MHQKWTYLKGNQDYDPIHNSLIKKNNKEPLHWPDQRVKDLDNENYKILKKEII
jgi:hypothetical protein